jgi:hypothetical protein
MERINEIKRILWLMEYAERLTPAERAEKRQLEMELYQLTNAISEK